MRFDNLSFEDYVGKYARSSCEVLLLGMNPGPFGMVQTGIPFGDTDTVNSWLRVKAWSQSDAGSLPEQHPKRPILGSRCEVIERSGQRLWSLARNRWDKPEGFFQRFFVYNYCPVAFVRDSPGGSNLTPDKLRTGELQPLQTACDEALREVIEALGPEIVVGVGKYAEGCARRCAPPGVRTGCILHPSPASPAGNGAGRWEELAAQQLAALGVELPPRLAGAISVK